MDLFLGRFYNLHMSYKIYKVKKAPKYIYISKIYIRYQTKTNYSCWFKKFLRKVLRMSNSKVEMRNFNPPPPLLSHFLCGGRLLWGIKENGHIWIDRCNVAMVTALDLASLGSVF